MSEQAARRYYEVIDAEGTSPGELAALYAEDATLKSPREGTFRGRDGVRAFYELNAEFFEAGTHHMTDFHADGDVVVSEGTVEGRTAAGRSYEGVGLADVMEFDDDDLITSHRVYLDYSAILSELPDDDAVPDFRE